MDRNDFSINSAKYDFLRHNPDLRSIAYLVVSGSYGYGTDNDDSDIDLRGFLVEDKKYLFGCGGFEQFEDIPTDTVIYGLKKFFNLCRAANPNTLELLGVDNDCIVMINEVGRKVRDNADIFLSKRVIHSFGNYAAAQLRRLSNALCHDSFDAARQEEYLRDTLAARISHFNSVYSAFDENAVNLYIEDGRFLADIHLNGYPLNDFVGIYSEMREMLRTMGKLNHRGRKKDETRLYKHAMHLIRLLITGTDILNGRGIITRRAAEHTLLMDIRNGKYTYSEIFAMSDEEHAKFTEAAKNTKLPDEPPLERIEELQIGIFDALR